MRVIAGVAKGCPLKAVPGQNTRPTTDKVKESIFSMIGPYFEGGAVLDLFAGTGSLGIEALSRGMDRAIFVDMDRKSMDIIQENLQRTRFTSQSEVYRNDARKALKALSKREIQFDLVFLDPPYRLHIHEQLVNILEEYQLIHLGTVIVLETDAKTALPTEIGGFSCVRQAEYGETMIRIYRCNDRVEE